MISLSENAKQWLAEGKPINVELDFTLDGDIGVIINGDEIESGSFTIDRNFRGDNSLVIGSAESAELSFTIVNRETYNQFRFGGASVELYYIIDNEKVYAGTFRVDEEPRRHRTITIRALDKMAQFRRKLPVINYPIRAGELLNQICHHCDVRFDTTDSTFTNSDMIIHYNEMFDSVNCQQMVGWIAGISGANAIINPSGLLTFVRSSYSDILIDQSLVIDVIESANPVTITGVMYETEDEVFVSGTQANPIDITNNPLINSENNIGVILNNIASHWEGFTYLPFEVLSYPFQPHLYPSHLIQLPSSSYYSLVTGITNRLNGVSDIVSSGSPEPETGLATGMLSDHELSIIASVVRRSQEIADAKNISGYQQAIAELHSEITNALGYYYTDIETTNGTVRYTHDKPELSESTYIEYKPAPGSLAWTDTGWNDGSPVWKMGYTQSGSLVMRILSAYEVNAERVIVGGGTRLIDELNRIETETNTTITDLGVTVRNNTEVDGVPVSTKVSELTANYISLTADVGNLKTGGGNLVRNPTFGSVTTPESDWWNVGNTLQELEVRGVTLNQLKASAKTLNDIRNGEV